MLRAGHVGGEAAHRALDAIIRNANAQVELIDDLLDVSRVISGKMRLEVQPVDLKAVIEAALDAVRPAAAAKQIRLPLDLASAILRTAGALVRTCSSVQAAIDALPRWRP
jgi:signal transduction histidine kinase